MSIQPKKRFGQHFLRHQPTIDRIAHTIIEMDNAGVVLEVGPGEGVLTGALLNHYGERYYAAEIDFRLQDHLLKQYPALGNRLIRSDFLKLKLDEQFPGRDILLVGNFPYNISSQIVFRMLDYKEQVPALVGMFQKEMAKRIAAGPGGKAYGVISVLAQAYYNVEYLFDVPPTAFRPPPKVDSGVIKMTRYRTELADCDEKLFKTVVKTAFNQRRKMLRNSLKGLVHDTELLHSSVFEKRPERLTLNDFMTLTRQLQQA